MTAPAQIAVTPDGVRVLADGFAAGAPVVAASGRQANAASVGRLDVLAGKVNTAAASRLRTTGIKLGRAATKVSNNETRSARQLPQVPILA